MLRPYLIKYSVQSLVLVPRTVGGGQSGQSVPAPAQCWLRDSESESAMAVVTRDWKYQSLNMPSPSQKTPKNINENPGGQIQSQTKASHFPNFPIRKKINRLNSRFKMTKIISKGT